MRTLLSGRNIMVTLLFIWGVTVPAYLFVRLALLEIRVAFALETVGIIEDLARPEKPVAGNDLTETVVGIEGYYPSGTKQVTGSRLDQLVEKYRRLAIEYVRLSATNRGDESH